MIKAAVFGCGGMGAIHAERYASGTGENSCDLREANRTSVSEAEENL
ncbi:hypothetical protein J23TS9_49230 [Paenibacillus sp. J23TS9]|nr:hypothetical protein [Paenibacillus sp. J23TS9]GIP29793.1 hypothetical protein J23TS9_49230 [Paenibacillus sp. J23TS9]